MLRLEDILDDAVRYLRGEMDAQEKEFFEAVLQEFPHLREELQVMDLARRELSALEREASTDQAGRMNRFLEFLRKNKLPILGIILLMILAVIGWGLLGFPVQQEMESSPEEALPNNNVVPVGLLKPAGRADSPITFEAFGGNSPSEYSDHGKAICWLPSGKVAFAATYSGQGSIDELHFSDNGKNDILLGVYDPNPHRKFDWILPFGGYLSDTPEAMASDQEGNIFVTGSFSGALNFGEGQLFEAVGRDNEGPHDFFVAKFDSLGQLHWFRHGGGNTIPNKQTGRNRGQAIAVTSQNEVVVAGSYVGSAILNGRSLPTGGPLEDAFVAKYTSEGTAHWTTSITSDQAVQVLDVGADPLGNIYVTGFFGHHKYGGQVFFKDTTLTSIGGRDIFLAKYSPQAELLWVRQAGSPLNESEGFDLANKLAIDSSGNCYLTGRIVGEAVFNDQVVTSYGGRDIFLAKYDPQGKLIWASHAGSPEGSGPFPEDARSMAPTPDGGVLVTGSFTGTAQFGEIILKTGNYANFFLAKYSSTGAVEWAKQFHIVDPANFKRAAGLSVAVKDTGRFAVSGFFSGTVAFDEKQLTSQGAVDIFMLIFDASGRLLSSQNTMRYS